MNITCLFIGILFVIVGVLFANGKLLKYIRAWNEMPESEKAKINVKKLYQNIGLMIVISGVIFVLNGTWDAFRERGFMIAIIMWLVLATVDLIYIEKSKQFQVKQ